MEIPFLSLCRQVPLLLFPSPAPQATSDLLGLGTRRPRLEKHRGEERKALHISAKGNSLCFQHPHTIPQELSGSGKAGSSTIKERERKGKGKERVCACTHTCTHQIAGRNPSREWVSKDFFSFSLGLLPHEPHFCL